VVAFIIGLPYGPTGVAWAYSIAIALMMLPLMMFSVSGTFLELRDYYDGVKYPALATIISGIIGGVVYQLISNYGLRSMNLIMVFAAMVIAHTSVSMKLNPASLRYATQIIMTRD
jgi:PST family polysaccharide transporter